VPGNPRPAQNKHEYQFWHEGVKNQGKKTESQYGPRKATTRVGKDLTRAMGEARTCPHPAKCLIGTRGVQTGKRIPLEKGFHPGSPAW